MGLIPFYVQAVLAVVISGVSFYQYTERDTLIRRIAILFSVSFLFSVLQYIALMLLGSGVLVNVFGTSYDLVSIFIIVSIYNDLTENRYRRTFTLMGVLVLLWSVIVLIFFQHIGENTSLSKLSISLMLLVFAIIYFYKLMDDLPAIHLHRFPAFWINSGFLFYAAGTVFLFAGVDYLIRVLKDTMAAYWPFHNMVFIVQQLIILAGLYYDFKNRAAKKAIH